MNLLDIKNKPFWKSKTIQGIGLVILSTFFPVIDNVLGSNLTQYQSHVSAIGAGLAGFGRSKANTKLTLKK